MCCIVHLVVCGVVGIFAAAAVWMWFHPYEDEAAGHDWWNR